MRELYRVSLRKVSCTFRTKKSRVPVHLVAGLPEHGHAPRTASRASSGCLCLFGVPSSAYLNHLDAFQSTVLFRCAQNGGVALICWMAQPDASCTAKIGIENLHKVCAEFLNAFTTSNAWVYDYLTTYPRSPLHPALTGAAMNMLFMKLRASSSTFTACLSTYSVDSEQRMWCLYGVGCSGTSRSLRVRKVQETLRSERKKNRLAYLKCFIAALALLRLATLHQGH